MSLTIFSLLALNLAAGAVEIYVSPKGDDTNPGTKEKPLLTLEGARDRVRNERRKGGLPAGGVTVYLGGGIYQRTSTFQLTKEDSGNPDSPIRYRGIEGETVRITGGVQLNAANAAPVKDEDVLARIPESAQSRIRVFDLAALGVKGIQPPGLSGHSMGNLHKYTRYKSGPTPSEVSFNDKPLTLARWPNTGFTTVGKVVIKGDTTRNWAEDYAKLPSYVPENKRKDPPEGFAFQPKDSSRLARWNTATDMMLLGYWFVDYSDQVVRVAKVDAQSGTVYSVQPSCYGIASGKRFFAFNLLEELDVPGEWYIDHKAQKLYFYPPSEELGATVSISLLGDPIVSLENVSHVTISGLMFSDARGQGIAIKDGANVSIEDCRLLGLSGDAVMITGGSKHRVLGCKIVHCGGAGITAEGGDERNLISADHVIDNNSIQHFARLRRTYHPGIQVSGVGIRVVNNEIAHAPHVAMLFSGNNHLIEWNYIHHVVQEAADMGAIYAGRSWTSRGTIIRHNLFKDIRTFEKTGGHAVKAIYLDDGISGIRMEGNVFLNVDQGVMINGGRDNHVINNLFISCGKMMRGTDAGINYMRKNDGSWLKLNEGLKKSAYRSEIWRKHYPKLHAILDEQPQLPSGNVVTGNACYGTPIDMTNEGIRPGFQKVSTIRDNHILKQAPGEFDNELQGFVIKGTAELLEKCPWILEGGFKSFGRGHGILNP